MAANGWHRVMGLVLALYAVTPATPQSAVSAVTGSPSAASEIDRLLDRARQELQANNESGGLALIHSVIAKLEAANGPDHLSLYPALDTAAKYYETKARLAEALRFRERAAAILEKSKRADDPELTLNLADLAGLCTATGGYDRAQTLYRRVLALPNLDPLIHANALNGLGDVYQQKGDRAEAKRAFEELVRFTIQVFGDGDTKTGVALYKLATLISTAGNYDQARPYAENSLRILEKNFGPTHIAVADALRALADINAGSGQIQQAESLDRRALAIYEKTYGKEDARYAHALDMLGEVLRMKGDLPAAEKLHLDALSVKEKTLGPNHPATAVSLYFLGSVYENSGDATKAEDYYSRALRVFDGIPNDILGTQQLALCGTLLNLLAEIRSEMGDYKRALPLRERSIQMSSKAFGEEHISVVFEYFSLGFDANSMGDTDRALRAWFKAGALADKIPRDNVQAAALTTGIGRGYMLAGQIENASRMFNEANERVRRWPEASVWFRVGPMTGLAAVDLAQKRFNEAVDLAKEVVRLIETASGPDNPEIVQPLSILNQVAIEKGDRAGAVDTLSRALDIEEKNLRRILPTGFEAQKTSFMSTLVHTTNRAILLHLDGFPRDPQTLKLALDTVLRRKGRVLEEVAQRSRLARDRLPVEDQHLVDELNSARGDFSALALQQSGGARSPALQALLRTKEQALQQLESTVLSKIPAYASAVAPVTLEQVREQLPVDAALVEVIAYQPDPILLPNRGPRRYAAYVLRRGENPSAVSLGGASEIDKQVSELRDALRDPKRTDVKALARSLDERVMKPVRPMLRGAKHIIISPDGALSLLPFEALVDETGKYLIERFSFSYLTSGRDLVTASATPSRSAPLIMANPAFDLAVKPEQTTASAVGLDFRRITYSPLPRTADEAEGIKRVLGNATVLTGADATEKKLKQVHGPEILHIATHGFFLSNQQQSQIDTRLLTLVEGYKPALVENKLLRSGLVLAGVKQGLSGEGEDGIVTALEISGLDLRGTKLVVLSACDTGVGDLGGAEGVYGLRRALVMAGAESQVLSFWPVSDTATRDLMVNFYQRLRAGEGLSEALRHAQLSMISNSKREHPYYWAAFTQAGDWRPITGRLQAKD